MIALPIAFGVGVSALLAWAWACALDRAKPPRTVPLARVVVQTRPAAPLDIAPALRRHR